MSIDAPDTKVRYQDETSTLIVDTDVPTSDGLTYTVQSVLPELHPRHAARRPTTTVPTDIAEQDAGAPGRAERRRPPRWPSEITAGATTPYDKAMALQDYFRDTGGFTYDLDVPAGHGDSAIDDFLASRRGYCEQFAGTFAAMARAVGLPARVAVGFTPGISDPTDPQRYDVKGEHAHAWPEVYLGQYGWVPFEPTPGRGDPNAEAYTGVARAAGRPGPRADHHHDVHHRPGTDHHAERRPTARSWPTGWPGSSSAGGDELDHARRRRGRPACRSPAAVAAGARRCSTSSPCPSLLALRRRRRRHAGPTTPPARVQLAWTESEEVLVAGRPGAAPGRDHQRVRVPGRGPGARRKRAGLADAGRRHRRRDVRRRRGRRARPPTQAEAVAVAVRDTVHRSVPKRRRVLRQLDGRRLIGAGALSGPTDPES